jgi:nucleotide-binding universal stress UspA family protein
MPSKNSIIVAGTTLKEIHTLLPFAEAFAAAEENSIVVLGLIAVPASETLSAGALDARKLRQAIEPRALEIGAKVIIRVAHDIWREARDTVRSEKATLVVLHWKSIPGQEWVCALPCDLAICKPPFPRLRPRILLPIRGGPYAALALRLALALSQSVHGEITVLHATPGEQPDNYYESFLQRLSQLPEVTRWVNAHGAAVPSISQAARRHQLVVMGASATLGPGDPPVGTVASQVLEEGRVPTLVVRAAHTLYAYPTPEPPPAPVDYTISVIVDKWFAENTFHAGEFQDLKQLVALKERQGLTTSLGLPTLNEEKTIGKIIQTVRAQFMGRYPLLDEIVVIDSNSTDRTVEIAQGLGVPVVKHPEVLTQYEKWVGKGEALWNSLYILRGDLIAWIDTDIVNIHPRFVYGILGPLIREPNLVYVKGFYQRPLRAGGKTEARGGGRVTELAARPLLNLFYPELSGFVQPLSGEYAGRRAALEQVPFFAGYGVEIGLLIDILAKFGLARIGQVDLEERVHRNQSITALSKMSFEIIQVVMQRVGQSHGIELVHELNKSMKLIRYERNEFQLDVADIRARERPPMITVPEYRARRELREG